MIRTLELTNYRGFEHYKLSNLARVNLLVGKNNSGKTSILEAVQLLASSAKIGVMAKIAGERGEVVDYVSATEPNEPRFDFDFSGFFHGREARPGSKLSLRIGSDLGDAALDADIVDAETHNGSHEARPSAFAFMPSLRFQSHAPEGVSGFQPPIREKIPLSSEDGRLAQHALDTLEPRRPRRDPAVQFVDQGSLDGESMAELWNELMLEDREREVEEAMRILEPRLSDIKLLSLSRSSLSRSRGGIIVRLEGEQRRSPLGSQGEGMRRLLALALCLATTKNGVLLIDEVDTGLHYSILGDVWLLIVEAAKRYNIQVFLTTHSLDCVRALAWLCGARPDLGPEVSIQKIERLIDEAVSLDAEQIQIAVEQDIEVR